MKRQIRIPIKSATVIMAVAFVVFSCSGKLKANGELTTQDTPIQVVDSMEIVQSDMGVLKLRLVTPLLERYQNDTMSWELFPKGFTAYAFDEGGKLETMITANNARHATYVESGSDKPRGEQWMAYDNVVINNLVDHRIMETDTLYWEPDREVIHTDSYVRIIDPRGLMQGYGMESDQRARRTVLHRVFNNYALIEKDTTHIEVDTVNFIGPFPKK